MIRICFLPTSRCRRLSALFLLGNQPISTSIAAVTGCMSKSQRMRASRVRAKRLLELEPLAERGSDMHPKSDTRQVRRTETTDPEGRVYTRLIPGEDRILIGASRKADHFPP